MDYLIYKLRFQTGVHFGNGLLNDSSYVFHGDTLFSAMYIEALKCDAAERFYELVCSGHLLFSDALPYVGDQYMIPKPMIYVEPVNRGDSGDKKKIKNIKYLPVGQLEKYLAGTMELDEDPMKGFGDFYQRTMAAVRKEGDTLPYQVGTYYYRKGNGLYLILGYDSQEGLQLAEELLSAVSLQGIGGKRSAGLGRFEYFKVGKEKNLLNSLNQEGKYYMLLSSALPTSEEMEGALEGASYLLDKRSGFVASFTYAEEFRKKKDSYVFAAGSCFLHRFSGGVYDVSEGGGHPVYRYAIPMFMGV